MARTAIQFLKGLSLPAFQRLHRTEEQCEAHDPLASFTTGAAYFVGSPGSLGDTAQGPGQPPNRRRVAHRQRLLNFGFSPRQSTTSSPTGVFSRSTLSTNLTDGDFMTALPLVKSLSIATTAPLTVMSGRTRTVFLSGSFSLALGTW